MNILKRLSILLLVSISCIGCDQSSKYYASEHLPRNSMSSYMGDVVRIGYTENTGAFLGTGSNLPENIRHLIFVVLVGLFLLTMLLYLLLYRKFTVVSLTALALMFAGGSSNFIDRAMNNGAVIDFLNVGFGSLRTGIFNIADVAILLGCFLFFIGSIRDSEPEKF